MVSFYSLPSSILGHDKHRTLCAAYSYYYFRTKTPLVQLMNDALILAKRHDFDVFNALDILNNPKVVIVADSKSGNREQCEARYNALKKVFPDALPDNPDGFTWAEDTQ